MVPPDWPLNAMSTFLSRSLRRLLHSRHEGMIIKNLSAGENLEASLLSNPWDNPLLVAPAQVAEETWEILREEGAIIEESLEDGCDHSSPKEKVDEKTTSPSDAVVGTSFNEKSDALHGHRTDAVDIHPDEHPPGDQDGQELL